jgi:hypothetical protein
LITNPTKQGPCQREKPPFSAKPRNLLRNWCSPCHPGCAGFARLRPKKFVNFCHPPPAPERNQDWLSIFESHGELDCGLYFLETII